MYLSKLELKGPGGAMLFLVGLELPNTLRLMSTCDLGDFQLTKMEEKLLQ